MTESPPFPVSGFDALIGLRFDEVTKDGVTASFDITPALQQPYGTLHGGVLCSGVETVGRGSGARTRLRRRRTTRMREP